MARRGEGGGQILRTALALSLITGRPLQMRRIRAESLEARAAAPAPDVRAGRGDAERHDRAGRRGRLAGALDFTPGEAWVSEMALDIGSAGSTTLVIQTILVPAIASGRALRARITGGTHNEMAPPFEYLDRVFLPHLREDGRRRDAHAREARHAAEGRRDDRGRGEAERAEADRDRGGRRRRAVSRHRDRRGPAAPRGGARARGARKAELVDPLCTVVELAHGPHNVFMAEVELASGARELATTHGRKGYPAEEVANDAIDALDDYVDAGVPVGEHLADQLLLPFAVAGGGRYRTVPLSLHATTNIETIRMFLDVPIRVDDGLIAFG